MPRRPAKEFGHLETRLVHHVHALYLALIVGGAWCCAGETSAPGWIDERNWLQLDVRPGRSVIEVGDSMRLRLGTWRMAFALASGKHVQWASSDTSIADIDSAGTIRGKRTGSVSISATAYGLTGHAMVDVAPAILVGAGDIADCSLLGDEATAALLDAVSGTVFTAGDNTQESGTPEEFARCYDPSWGRHKSRTRPAPGNHDYLTPGAAGYFAYFGSAAGDPAQGYYSYDRGAWHIVVMNSNLPAHAGSLQEQWLRADLDAHKTLCTLGYWHYPRFSSGYQGGHASMEPLWDALYDAGAEVVIAGHDHDYERFAPQTPTGLLDSAGGIRQFVVGTGGTDLLPFNGAAANSELRNNTTLGVLLLKLYDGWYEWEFISTQRDGFGDSGAGRCH
jgi:hypothetical protein